MKALIALDRSRLGALKLKCSNAIVLQRYKVRTIAVTTDSAKLAAIGRHVLEAEPFIIAVMNVAEAFLSYAGESWCARLTSGWRWIPSTFKTCGRNPFGTVTDLSPSHFSFNRPEGACPACQGMGAVEVRMRYLPSTWIPCAGCGGQRFADEVLAARIEIGGRLLSIADLYAYPIADAVALLSEDNRLSEKNRRSVERIGAALHDVGLGYLPLGQPAPTPRRWVQISRR